MKAAPYPVEVLDGEADNGTMVNNVAEVRESVVGHKIVVAGWRDDEFIIQLDNESEVRLRNTDDCCAYTALEAFLLHPDRVDHVIMGVGTTDEYGTWHIYCDYGDILELTVGWSAGNPFYYGYGFDIEVEAL